MSNWDAVPIYFQMLYEDIVKQSIINDDIFNSFRSNPSYTIIVGNNMPQHEIESYYNDIKKYPNIMDKIDNIKKMDNIGSPEINSIINMSSRNLKYMYSALIIYKYFKDIKNVVEIGVGYGGLCYTLHQYFSLDGYKLLDIEYVVDLTKKFLSKLDLYPKDIDPPYDLLISECALTELNDNAIKYYYDNYILKSNKLLIRTNFGNKNRLKDFISMIKKNFTINMITDYPNANEEPTVILGWKK